MKVAERDPAVDGILEEEYRRCLEALSSLQAKASGLPKGALNVRRKFCQGKEYRYHYLVLRQDGRVVNRHVPEKEVMELKKRLEQRDKIRQEMGVYRKRITYLKKLLGIPAGGGGTHERSA